MREDCLFCKIAAGDIPAKMVYEDEKLVVFRDINPQAPQHLLIVPRKHIRTTVDLTTADNELVGHIHQVAGKLAHDLGFADNGFRLVNNCNADGGQVVWHIHFHLLGGREMGWPPG
ncbi:MAG: histidine triad nucleotide-binding protein [Desulfuromonas sp.]|nr:MAG: histidine triad nucleotide-binding protein [Desulfuromonas sp.]